MAPLYALVWRRDGSPGITWYIRCLAPEGFSGEVGFTPTGPPPREGRVVGVSGHLTPTDRERVAAILAELSAAGPTEPGPCFALLASYTTTLGQGHVLFKYELGAEASCARAQRLLGLHAIIESYMTEAYAQITEPNAAPGPASDIG